MTVVCRKRHILLHEFIKEIEQQENSIQNSNEDRNSQDLLVQQILIAVQCTLPTILAKTTLASFVVGCDAFVGPGAMLYSSLNAWQDNCKVQE